MSSAPTTGKPRSAADMDLFELPGIRTITRVLRRSIMANRAARLEGKILLYTELAEAMRQGVPAAEALRMCAQTVAESRVEDDNGFGQGAEARWKMTKRLYSLFFLIFGNLSQILLIMFSGTMVDSERIARLLALRLFEGVSRGMPLSSAMAAFGNDFDRAESAIVALGERCGNLPDAVARLSQYQKTSKLLAESSGRFTYPAFVLSLSYIVVFTIFGGIVPKFVDIFEQLGAELPMLTRFTITFATDSRLLFALISFPAAFVVLFTVLRSLLNGSLICTFQRGITSFAFIAMLLGSALAFAIAFLSDAIDATPNPDLVMFFIIAGASFLLLAILPFIMLAAEFFVLRAEDALGWLFRFVPILGRAFKKQDDARWLAALSTAIAGGMPLHDAARAAAAASPGRMATRSIELSVLLGKGVSLPEALNQVPVIRREAAARLALLGGRSDFQNGLMQLAADDFELATFQLVRFHQICSLLSMAAIGVILGVLVLSLYLPLFSIPMIVR